MLRLNSTQFYGLLEMVHVMIQKEDTIMRKYIPAKTKLEITLCTLSGKLVGYWARACNHRYLTRLLASMYIRQLAASKLASCNRGFY